MESTQSSYQLVLARAAAGQECVTFHRILACKCTGCDVITTSIPSRDADTEGKVRETLAVLIHLKMKRLKGTVELC